MFYPCHSSKHVCDGHNNPKCIPAACEKKLNPGENKYESCPRNEIEKTQLKEVAGIFELFTCSILRSKISHALL